MLEQIQIQNYKSCKDITIKLLFPLTAMIGKTGAGKTNVLSGCYWSCLLGFSGALPDTNQNDIQRGFSARFICRIRDAMCYYDYRIVGKKNLKIYVQDRLSVTKGGKKEYIFSKIDGYQLKLSGYKNALYIPADHSGLAYIKEQLVQKRDLPNYMKDIKTFDNYIAGLLLDLSRVKYFGLYNMPDLGLFMIQDFDHWKENRLCNNDNMLFSFQYYDLFKNSPSAFAEMKTLLKTLGLIEDIQLSEMKAENEAGQEYDFIVWRFLMYGKALPFFMLSNGIRRIIWILFHLFYGKLSLLLIQEPEISIHAGLYAKLLSIFREYAGDRKIFISTYSEQILHRLTPDQVIYVVNKKGTTTVKYIKERHKHRYLQDLGKHEDPTNKGFLTRLKFPGNMFKKSKIISLS